MKGRVGAKDEEYIDPAAPDLINQFFHLPRSRNGGKSRGAGEIDRVAAPRHEAAEKIRGLRCV